MSDATFTFRVEKALKEQFTKAAKVQDLSGVQLLRDFMREFVRQQQVTADHDQWFRQQIQTILDSAKAENLVPAAKVEAKFAARRAATRRKFESVK